MQWRIVLRHDRSDLRDPVVGVCDNGTCMATALAGMPQVCPKTGVPESDKEVEPEVYRVDLR